VSATLDESFLCLQWFKALKAWPVGNDDTDRFWLAA